MPRHDDQVELHVSLDGAHVAQNPVHVLADPRVLEHGGCGIEPAQLSSVAGLPRSAKELAGATAHVEDAASAHHERQVEGEVGSPRAEGVIERGEPCFREEAVDHAPSLVAASAMTRGDFSHRPLDTSNTCSYTAATLRGRA